MEFLTDYALWASFLSLTALEVVLGIDNVVFIALLVNHLPEEKRQKARVIGILLALFMRIALLFCAIWLIGLKEPWVEFFGHPFSGKDFLMIGGGLFLIAKGTTSIHDEISEDPKENYKSYSAGFQMTILQVIFIDFIFSFDSIITAVGLTNNIWVIIAAMVVAMLVMLFSSKFIAEFIDEHPTLKMLALSFIMMIGVFLVAEGLGFHVPRGYIYFGMAFSLGVEILNMLVKRRKTPR
ncbi:TerC family protein [Sneathiella sp. HT1-7]|uniref:TerC family protein n=1 Tax=Sneathiella sp. HT1-7 TaxID=2887192 RepID=UPI001D149482|nr:TerC family protein [Sneathiella sp. HT1-7]MCC3303954.1 TerC family protein [Sneathiella sp. HT1-7]